MGTGGERIYQGISVTEQEIHFIRQLIKDNPNDSRRRLSQKLCKAWNWVQPNGRLRDMVCRSFMLCLERKGYIKLPQKRCTPANPLARRQKPPRIEVDRSPISSCIGDLKPLEIRQVRRTPFEKLYNSLIAHYHYLGYCHSVGEHLKYVVFSAARPIACIGWSSAVRHLACRDKFVGWTAEIRKKNLHLIAYNTRYLILPWVHVKNLGSHLLAVIGRRLSADWQQIYKHPVCLLETFVDNEKFKGTSYQAANWIYLGLTTGRGKNDQTHKPNRSLKAVWCYPLCRHFRQVMQHG
jgi:hypothetical protein